jgi:putative transport protein
MQLPRAFNPALGMGFVPACRNGGSLAESRRVPTWILEMGETQPVAWAVLVLSAVAVAGLALSSLKVRGIGPGIAAVLFAGIAAGHFGIRIQPEILEFVREFGLVLFVFTIGLQLGPGFFASLKNNGARLNALAAAVVALGVASTVFLVAATGMNPFAGVGLFTGATTNTPALGAAQQTVAIIAQGNAAAAAEANRAALPALAYAVGYPAGIFGIIAAMLALGKIFRIDPAKEAAEFDAARKKGTEPLVRMNLVVENPNLDGLPIGEIPGRREIGVMVSRIKRSAADGVEAATEQTAIHTGDRILAIGTAKHLDAFRLIVGRKSGMDLMHMPGRVAFRRVVATRKEVLGKTIAELGLDSLYGVAITRVLRGEVELAAAPELRLRFGDFLHVVGDEEHIAKASAALGNSLRALNQTNFIPIFLGILLGVLAGMVPFAFPGLPVPVRLGLAGGPLVLAILLSRIRQIGSVVWFMPATANTAIREMGIILFLACVGLKAGENFVPAILGGDGLLWLVCACAITTVPLLAVGIFARAVLKTNFIDLCGLLSGSMTDPPALAFANSVAKSDSPSIAYATVYPLAMLLRILSAQLLVLLFAR